MTHPPVEELLAGGDAARAHLDSCPACRRVVALADDPAAPRAPGADGTRDGFPDDVIDRARYGAWSALGAGGMGHLFRAHDARIGREVVIKQPRGRELRARFEREALLTARLQHPAIVGVYEVGRFADGEPFFAMPLVRGAPLSDEIARRATPEARLALLSHVTAVCEAVAYAHEQGIVHRDLKPANMLVGSFGETVVIDWGLAADLHARDAAPAGLALDEVGDGLTQLGVGTPHYMPPEQARGGAADPRMDVYALGATLYHTLAGAPPYGGLETAKVRPRLLVEPPAALATLAPSVAPALRDIVARAMARDPAARFASARELAAELRRFQTGQLVQSRRYSPGEILRHFARRYRAPLAVAAIAATLLAGVATVSALRVTRAGSAARAAQARAEANERASRTELRRGMGVTATRLAQLPTRRAEALSLAVAALAPSVAGGEAPVAEARQGLHDAIAGAATLVLEGHSAPLGAFAFSVDGARVAGMSPGDHSVHLWDARTGAYLARVAAGGAHFAVDALAFSPDGARLLTWGRAPAQAQLWSVGVDAAPLTLAHDGALAGAGFLADGALVLAGHGLAFLDGAGRPVRQVALASPATALAIAGDRVAVAGNAGVEVWNARGERVAQLATATPVIALALTADGAQVAALERDAVTLHDLAGAAPPRRIALASPERARLGFTASRRHLVVARGGGLPALVVDTSGAAPPAELSPAMGELGVIDGDGVWSASPERLALVDLDALAPVRAFVAPPGLAITALAVGPGPRVVVATESEAWMIDARAVATGELVGHASEVAGVVRTGPYLLSAGLDGRVLAWGAGGDRVGTARLGSEVLAVAAATSSVVVGGLDGVARIVAVGAGGGLSPGAALGPPGTAIVALAITGDAARVAVARIDGELVVVTRGADGTPGATVRLREPSPYAVAAVAFAPDASTLAVIDVGGHVELWDPVRGTRLAETALPTVDDLDRAHHALVFADPTRLLVARYGGETSVLSLPTLTPRAPLDGRVVAVSTDGARVVTATATAELVVHDAGATGRRAASLPRPLTAAALSPDGRLLAAGDSDGLVRVLDLATPGAPPLELAGAGGAVSALAFSADARHLAVGHASGALRLHPLEPADALARACATLLAVGRAEPGCLSRPPPAR